MATKLPQKENGVFKKIVRSYESKQYKNGLKFSRQILSNPKFAEHGETLVMKGLILNCIGRKEEAYDHVRRGLKNDIKSHVCWHVYGLLQRSDKKYDEAIKCYRNALKWDKDNLQILRDLSLLQIQMRDLEGFRDTRYQLLKTRPAQQSSWVGYAVSFHLMEDYEMALKVMAEYRRAQPPPKKLPDYEFSEMLLYEVQIMLEAGQDARAVAHMNEFSKYISDTLSCTEIRGEILLKQGKRAEAEVIYRDLLYRNPENYEYYQKLEECLDLPTPAIRLALYEMLQGMYPRAHVCRRIPLGFTTGETFSRLMDTYLRAALHKGVPSLFKGIQNLYTDSVKVSIIGAIAEGYIESLESFSKFDENDTGATLEPPTVYLWTLFFLSQHYDRTGEYAKALEYVDRAIAHTPTHIELYMFKSKIFKHAGDLVQAARWIEEARAMDTADRFVNCKCVKYLLRMDQTEEAIKLAGFFTRDGLPTLQTLDDMQCVWFQTELARAYRRLGQYGKALVKLHEIDQHFTDIIEDQFDFHTYCMRKMTLRAYINVLRLEDNLRNHKFYCETAREAIELYVYLHDNPGGNESTPVSSHLLPSDTNNLSASERKKLARKQRKALAKAEAKAQEEKKENKPQGKQANADEDKKSKDDQKVKLDPQKLVSVDSPLDEAIKFLAPLLTLAKHKIDTHLLAYTIHSRRRKFLLMLKALKCAHSLDPHNPQYHADLIDFLLMLDTAEEFPPPVKTVIDTVLPSLTGGQSPDHLNQEFLARHAQSVEHLIIGAQVMYRLHPDSREKVIGILTSLPDKNCSLKMCLKVQNQLRGGKYGDCTDALQEFDKCCHSLYPLAIAFKPPSPPAEPVQGEEASAEDAPSITDTNHSSTADALDT